MKKTLGEKPLSVGAASLLDQLRTNPFGGGSTPDDRLYKALGFPPTISYSDYLRRFKRQDIANRIVKAPVDGVWKEKPEVYDSKDHDTVFEDEFRYLEKTLSLYSVLTRLDIMATLGEYAVLFLGLNDNMEPSMPVTKASGLEYISAIPQDRALIQTWDQEKTSPRCGLPLTYEITINSEQEARTTLNPRGKIVETVHWSRIIHVAEGTLESELYGIPYLEPVYNRLIGLDKLAGSSPEMYYKGARPGYMARTADNLRISDEEVEAFKTELDDYFNKDMNRVFYANRMEMDALAIQVVSPKEHIETQLTLISAATKIPMRILTGSERGELASSQDERAWLTYLEERRGKVAEDLILRPFLDRLILFGVLATPKDNEYVIEWPPIVVKSEKERMEIALLKQQVLETWGRSMAQDAYPLEVVLKDLGKTDAEIDLQLAMAEDAIIEEDKDRPEQQEPEQPENEKI